LSKTLHTRCSFCLKNLAYQASCARVLHQAAPPPNPPLHPRCHTHEQETTTSLLLKKKSLNSACEPAAASSRIGQQRAHIMIFIGRGPERMR
jgi:hypothetical protein